MDQKPQKPSLLFASPLSSLTELAFKLWGFGKLPAREEAPEKQVAVAVIPTREAREASKPKRATAKARSKAKPKSKSKRSRR